MHTRCERVDINDSIDIKILDAKLIDGAHLICILTHDDSASLGSYCTLCSRHCLSLPVVAILGNRDWLRVCCLHPPQEQWHPRQLRGCKVTGLLRLFSIY